MNTSSIGTDSLFPQNDFKPFAIGEGANVLEQSEYERSGFLKEGFKKGMARSSEINKAIRQGSSIAAAVARFTASKTGEDMLDNGDIDTLSQHIETAIRSVSSLLIAEADGTSDALMATFSPAIKQLKNGLLAHVRARTMNVTGTPTFKADETGAKVIVKGNNLPLAMGDIAGAGHWLELQYDEALDKWILQNPAKGISPASGVPVGTIEYFAMAISPAGYLIANGAVVGRETYPELFAAIGTTYGEGDGKTTFNLPNLIDRFAQGSNTPGQYIAAGLPDHNHSMTLNRYCGDGSITSYAGWGADRVQAAAETNYTEYASASNPTYGASDTVQPPALTLLPCIKAFDAATNLSLIDITELANEMAGKVPFADFNRSLSKNGYQKFPGGLILQWGRAEDVASNTSFSVVFPVAFPSLCTAVTLMCDRPVKEATANPYLAALSKDGFTGYYSTAQTSDFLWFAIGY